MSQKTFYVYILTNALKTVLYTGVTNDLLQRITEHYQNRGQQYSFCGRYNVCEDDISSGTFSWSEGMYRIFGLPQGSRVSPETYLDFSMEEDRSVARRIIKNLKKGHDSFEEVMRIKRGHHQRLLKIKGSLVRDEAGKLQRMIGVDVDMSDMNEAEQKLEESRNLLEQTAIASPDAITVYDLQKKVSFT